MSSDDDPDLISQMEPGDTLNLPTLMRIYKQRRAVGRPRPELLLNYVIARRHSLEVDESRPGQLSDSTGRSTPSALRGRQLLDTAEAVGSVLARSSPQAALAYRRYLHRLHVISQLHEKYDDKVLAMLSETAEAIAEQALAASDPSGGIVNAD